MSNVGRSDMTQTSTSVPKSKKINNKKKKPGSKAKDTAEAVKTNGINQQKAETEEGEIDAEPSTPVIDSQGELANGVKDLGLSNGSNGTGVVATEKATSSSSLLPKYDAQQRMEAMSKDRDALQNEVAKLKETLDQIQSAHQEELSNAQEKLEESQSEKEEAEAQYQTLLGKVGTIKSQLRDRLEADAAGLSQAKAQIEELEGGNRELTEQNRNLHKRIQKLLDDDESRSKELSSLRNRTNLSQQNWSSEREDLISREAFAKEEFEAAKQAMQDWEILAMEERSVRENLAEKVADLEEQLASQRDLFESAISDRDSQASTVDGLQRALQQLQTARKQELRELVENNQTQVDSLKKQLQESERTATEAGTSLQTIQKELERALPFEKEVKEKNLLIGKLRHEAVILNDHLTKALRYLKVLKKGKPEDNVDRQIVTNHFLHFLTLDRSDPKKFQILQLIAALLNWTDEEREQAGLARPGQGSTLRAPFSPFLRTPSSPALTSELFPDTHNKESLAELWSSFLEQEAQDGSKSKSGSQSGSVSSSSRPPKSGS